MYFTQLNNKAPVNKKAQGRLHFYTSLFIFFTAFFSDSAMAEQSAPHNAGEFMAGKKLIMAKAKLDVKKITDTSISMKEFL